MWWLIHFPPTGYIEEVDLTFTWKRDKQLYSMAAVNVRPQASWPVLVYISQVYVAFLGFMWIVNLKFSLPNVAIVLFLYVHWLVLKHSSINLFVCNSIFNNKQLFLCNVYVHTYSAKVIFWFISCTLNWQLSFYKQTWYHTVYFIAYWSPQKLYNVILCTVFKRTF